MDDVARFRVLLTSIAGEKTEEIQSAQAELESLQSENWKLYLELACTVGFEGGENLNMSFVALKEGLSPRYYRSIRAMRSVWLKAEMTRIRDSIKQLIQNHLLNEVVSTRKLSAVCAALVLQIEGYRDWNVLPSLVGNRNVDEATIANLFIEVCQVKVFSKTGDASEEWYLNILIEMMFQGMKNVELCGTCLKMLAKTVPYHCNNQPFFKHLREALDVVNISTFEELNGAMLGLMEGLPEDSIENAAENVMDITITCMKTMDLPRKLASVKLWEELWKHELLEGKKLNMARAMQVYPGQMNQPFRSLVAQTAMILTPYALDILSVIEQEDTGADPERLRSPEEEVLRFGKSVLAAVRTCNKEMWGEFTKQLYSEVQSYGDTWVQCQRAVLVMRILAHQSDDQNVYEFLYEQVEFVGSLLQTGVPRLVDNCIGFLSDLIKGSRGESATGHMNEHFQIVCSCCQGYLRESMKLLKRLIKYSPPEAIDEYFNSIFELVIELLPRLPNTVPSRILTLMIKHCSRHYDKHLIEIIETFCHALHSREEGEKYLAIDVLTALVIRLQSKIEERLPLLCSTLFPILENPDQTMYCDAMLCFSLMNIANTNFEPYATEFVRVVEVGFSSGIPVVVKLTGLALGDFCKALGDRSITYATNAIDICFHTIVSAQTADEVTQQVVVPDLLTAGALIIQSIGTTLESTYIHALWDSALSYSEFSVDLDLETDVSYAARLYSAVCTSVASVVRAAHSLEMIDREFLLLCKKRVCPLYDRIAELRCMNKRETTFLLARAFDLFYAFMDTRIAKKLTAPLHRPSFLALCHLAINYENPDLIRKGLNIITILGDL